MRAIIARESKRAKVERQAAREAHDAAHAAAIADELARRRAAQAPASRAAAKQEPPRRTVSDERERQRVEHLVLGRHRPKQRVGRGRAKRHEPVALTPSVDAAVRLREDWSHKQGTPETHAHVAQTREGSLSRLWHTGAIDSDQLAAAVDIATVYERIGADVSVRTASLEARVDHQRHGDGFYEALGQVRREMAYRRWWRQVDGPIAAVLDMLVGETVGFTVVARRYRMHNRRAKKLLIDALDLWPRVLGQVCKEVDEATLLAAQAGILG